jgi:hypothetical protein
MPRLRSLCICLLVLPLAAIGSTPASAAAPRQPLVYLAMGDSVAVGVGAKPPATEALNHRRLRIMYPSCARR